MSTRVPLLDLAAQYAPLREAILAAVTRVCDSQRFIMGPEIDALEHELAAMLGVRHAVAVSSGTDALLVALMALGISRGDEVITSPFSFFASAGAIARLGATPLFVDIDVATYNVDAERIGAAITPRTKAILPVHLFGLPADMGPSPTRHPRLGFQSSRMPPRRLAPRTRVNRRAVSEHAAACRFTRARISGHSVMQASSPPTITSLPSASGGCASTAWSRSITIQ